jgi:hypothetical protein
VSYPIIDDEEEYTAFSEKRMVDVKPNMRVSPEVQREIAPAVKGTEKHQQERTFIFFYLPEAVPGVRPSPWARGDFDRTRKVEIMGLTQEAGGPT